MKVLAFLAFAAFVGLSQSASLKKVADCDGTVCPGGCCPEQNWYCCPDGMYCAANAGNCPFVGAKEKLIKFAAAKEVVALNKTGTAAQMVCTVLPMLETAHLLLLR